MKSFADFGIQVPAGRSGEVDTTCPQCSAERKKKHARCLSVSVEKGTWICHHCGWAGGLGDGAKRFEAPWRKPAHRRPEPLAAKPVDAIAQWFAERGISREVLDRNGVRPARVYMPQVEDHVTAIAFPYRRGEDLVNVKYRDREKNFRMEAGAERVLYGLGDIDAERCCIVEGEIDKLSLEMAGIVSCVSVPDGAPAENARDYSGKFTFLDADADRIGAVREWIIAVDNDGPGKRLEDELARRLGRDKCRRVTWPSDCKDANDVLRSFGAQVLRECIENAQAFPLAGVFHTEDCADKVRQLHERGWEKGVATGWGEVDQFYTVRPGEFTVVTGMPNSGKSNWLDALCVNLAAIHGWRFALFSPENQPIEDHMGRMVEKWVGKPFDVGPSARLDRAELDEGLRWVGEHFTWILPDDDADWTIERVLDLSKSLVFREGIRGLVIDPWNELEHHPPGGMSETIYIGNVLKHVRQFARRHGVHVWIVAHPQKLLREKDGNYPIPTMYDIAGSANWRNKADNGVVIWRDFTSPDTPIEVHVQKVRFRQVGRIGMAKLKYHVPTGTYQELGFFDPRNNPYSQVRA
ncbi:MAG: toprim domain-containing protein [Gammaproteobacteria bacterium]|nr:toprim domain-containing protein [Gammaproteobacteria bacterium]